MDSGNNRLQVFTPEGKLVASCGKAGSGDGEFNQPWGITTDKDGNIYVADWKNHRVQKLSSQGHFLMKIGSYGAVAAAGRCLRGYLPWTVRVKSAGSHYPKAGLLNHPTDVAVDPDGDIYVTDWGNHRVCIFEADGTPLTNLYGDAQVFSKWAKQSVDANPDMMKAYRRVRNSEPLYRFCFPTAVDFNPATDEIIVADSQRNRLQVYRRYATTRTSRRTCRGQISAFPSPPLGAERVRVRWGMPQWRNSPERPADRTGTMFFRRNRRRRGLGAPPHPDPLRPSGRRGSLRRHPACAMVALLIISLIS